MRALVGEPYGVRARLQQREACAQNEEAHEQPVRCSLILDVQICERVGAALEQDGSHRHYPNTPCDCLQAQRWISKCHGIEDALTLQKGECAHTSFSALRLPSSAAEKPRMEADTQSPLKLDPVGSGHANAYQLLQSCSITRTRRTLSRLIPTTAFSVIGSSAYQLERAANFESTTELVAFVLEKLPFQMLRHLGRVQDIREAVLHSRDVLCCSTDHAVSHFSHH